MHINWLKIQICVLRCMLRSHARNENECQTPCHRHSAANIEIPGFLILVNPKLVWIHETWHAIMELHQQCRGKFFVPFGAGLGICFSQTRASHNKPDGFGRERPTFGDETISIASYCFQIFSHVNIEQQECWVIYCDFSGFVWTFLCINWVFNAFMCIIQICALDCMLRSHARNGNECQTPCHGHSAANIEIPGF